MKITVTGGNNGVGLKPADKAALIAIVNEAESLETTLKNDLATLIRSKDGSLNIPTAPSWEQLKAAISNVYIGKKWASGTVTSSATSPSCQIQSGGGATVNLALTTVTGLNFTPSVVYLFTAGAAGVEVTVFSSLVADFYSNVARVYGTLGNSTATQSSYCVKADVAPLSVGYGGFTLPVFKASTTYSWIAFQ